MVYLEEMAEMELPGEMVWWAEMGLLDLRDIWESKDYKAKLVHLVLNVEA